MIAAHYIALLLLSTAAEGSREHHQIIELNGAGIWASLLELELVERVPSELGWLYRLSDRGQVLVAHILALPLPQRVSAYSMGPQVTAGGAHIVHSPRMTATEVAARQSLGSIEQQSPPPTADDDNYVHTVAPVSMLPRVEVPTDSGQRRAAARAWLDKGYSVNEVAEMLKLEQAEVEAIFFGGGTG